MLSIFDTRAVGSKGNPSDDRRLEPVSISALSATHIVFFGDIPIAAVKEQTQYTTRIHFERLLHCYLQPFQHLFGSTFQSLQNFDQLGRPARIFRTFG